jgi:hypothetical protein
MALPTQTASSRRRLNAMEAGWRDVGQRPRGFPSALREQNRTRAGHAANGGPIGRFPLRRDVVECSAATGPEHRACVAGMSGKDQKGRSE